MGVTTGDRAAGIAIVKMSAIVGSESDCGDGMGGDRRGEERRREKGVERGTVTRIQRWQSQREMVAIAARVASEVMAYTNTVRSSRLGRDIGRDGIARVCTT
jgi:hypothetical protein